MDIDIISALFLCIYFAVNELRFLKHIKKLILKIAIYLLAVFASYFLQDYANKLQSIFFWSVVTNISQALLVSFVVLLFWWIIPLFKILVKFVKQLPKFLYKIFQNKKFTYSLIIFLIFAYIFSVEYRLYRLYSDTGGYSQFFCSENSTKNKTKNSVVRIVGALSEGTGFFVKPDEVLTNNHVIEGETSPKVILPNGKFLIPKKIETYKDGDLAIITISESHPELVLNILDSDSNLVANETIIAVGFPLGTDIKGEATILQGTFQNFRDLKGNDLQYIQTNIPLVEGMSGGPAVDRCGNVVGVNTLAVSGTSFLIRMSQFGQAWSRFTLSDQTQVRLDPGKSPQEAVEAYYTFLKVRDMKSGFDLLSQEYLQKTDFSEWTSRFPDVIDVSIINAQMVENSKDTVFVKFVTSNWNNNDLVRHFYEGTWQTIFENGKYKMLKSKIIEVISPDDFWFYE